MRGEAVFLIITAMGQIPAFHGAYFCFLTALCDSASAERGLSYIVSDMLITLVVACYKRTIRTNNTSDHAVRRCAMEHKEPSLHGH